MAYHLRCIVLALLPCLAVPAGGALAQQPSPIQQLDFPILAPGQTATMRLQVPAHVGGQGTVAYAAFAVDPAIGHDYGYRFGRVACPDGFDANVHPDDRGVVCYRHGNAPHPPFVMLVDVRNVAAADGETVGKAGLSAVVLYGGRRDADWYLYGVGAGR